MKGAVPYMKYDVLHLDSAGLLINFHALYLNLDKLFLNSDAM